MDMQHVRTGVEGCVILSGGDEDDIALLDRSHCAVQRVVGEAVEDDDDFVYVVAVQRNPISGGTPFFEEGQLGDPVSGARVDRDSPGRVRSMVVDITDHRLERAMPDDPHEPSLAPARSCRSERLSSTRAITISDVQRAVSLRDERRGHNAVRPPSTRTRRPPHGWSTALRLPSDLDDVASCSAHLASIGAARTAYRTQPYPCRRGLRLVRGLRWMTRTQRRNGASASVDHGMLPAIDMQRLAGHSLGQVGAEEDDDVGDVGIGRDPTQRERLTNRLDDILELHALSGGELP